MIAIQPLSMVSLVWWLCLRFIRINDGYLFISDFPNTISYRTTTYLRAPDCHRVTPKNLFTASSSISTSWRIRTLSSVHFRRRYNHERWMFEIRLYSLKLVCIALQIFRYLRFAAWPTSWCRRCIQTHRKTLLRSTISSISGVKTRTTFKLFTLINLIMTMRCHFR